MQNKLKVVNKGYTITVTSWENDGDNYNTKSVTVDSLEEATALYNLSKLCESRYTTDEIKLGNANEFDNEQLNLIYDFIKNNPILLEGYTESNVSDCNESLLLEVFYDYHYDLFGSSEHYSSRVCEKVTVTYSPEDIYVEQIKF
jgi:hypothetical protein